MIASAMSLPLIATRGQFAGWLACTALVSMAISGGAGAVLGYRYADQRGAANLATLQAEHAKQLAAATQQSAQRYQQQVARGNQLATDLLAQRVQTEQLAVRLRTRIPHVTTTYQTATDPAPVAIPRCVFTRGWVRDYNAAFGLPGHDTTAAGFDTAEQASEAASFDGELLDAHLTPADILAHAEDMAAYCRAIDTQLDAVIAERMSLSTKE